MRIRGDGSDFSGFSGGGGSRSDTFRKGRRPGQKVRGTLVKWVAEDMAWVQIEGVNLLAQLQSKPPVGSSLDFVIKQLVPEIVLKEIFDPGGDGGGALTIAGSFETARTLFEGRLRPHTQLLARTSQAKRAAHLISLMADDVSLFAAYMDAITCAGQINTHLAGERTGRIAYQPWLTPLARRQLTRTRTILSGGSDGGILEVTVECESPSLGLVKVEFLHKPPTTGFRVKIQNPNHVQMLKQTLETIQRFSPLQSVDCLGVTKLPRSAHGGILSEFISTR
jgi:hypothetical protein